MDYAIKLTTGEFKGYKTSESMMKATTTIGWDNIDRIGLKKHNQPPSEEEAATELREFLRVQLAEKLRDIITEVKQLDATIKTSKNRELGEVMDELRSALFDQSCRLTHG